MVKFLKIPAPLTRLGERKEMHGSFSFLDAGGADFLTVQSELVGAPSEMPRISCTLHWTGPRVRLSLRKGA